MDELTREYEKLLARDENKLAAIKRRLQRTTILRFLSFIGIILSFIYLHSPWNYLLALLLVVIFLNLVHQFITKEKEKKLVTRLRDINQRELIALQHIYDQFEDGVEFTDIHHAYSYDLDFYGEGGLFQFINRTTTQLGKKKLADSLNNPITGTEELKNRQESLLELAQYTRWRQYLAAKGQNHDENDLKLLSEKYPGLKKQKLIRTFTTILPAISLLSILLFAFSIIPWGWVLIAVFTNITVLFSFRKEVQHAYYYFGNQSKILDSYRDLLLHIEKKKFESNELVLLQKQLFSQDKKASKVIEELMRKMAAFDYRANLAFALFAEPLLLWDLLCVLRLDTWYRKYSKDIIAWFEVIATFDAWSSFANLNHNHPQWPLPDIEKKTFCLSANGLGHPLINPKKRIGNNFSMKKEGQIEIITGANMAGKSTFLRTIGVNMILAMNGCRVCSTSFSLKPIRLYTNMRTTDNLQKDESYFFAELSRLQNMLNLIKSGEPHFIIIDEMLKGTNSIDKLNGSIALAEQLISLNTNGIVATHDLKLTELAGRYHNIRNSCFEVRLGDDNLIFDYKLREGVTQTMNASFLMKKMGIVP